MSRQIDNDRKIKNDRIQRDSRLNLLQCNNNAKKDDWILQNVVGWRSERKQVLCFQTLPSTTWMGSVIDDMLVWRVLDKYGQVKGIVCCKGLMEPSKGQHFNWGLKRHQFMSTDACSEANQHVSICTIGVSRIKDSIWTHTLTQTVTGKFQTCFTKMLVVNVAVLVVLSHCLVLKSAGYASAGMFLWHVTTCVLGTHVLLWQISTEARTKLKMSFCILVISLFIIFILVV